MEHANRLTDKVSIACQNLDAGDVARPSSLRLNIVSDTFRVVTAVLVRTRPTDSIAYALVRNFHT